MAFILRFEDHFVEAGDPLLTAHTPDTAGVSWSVCSGSAGNNAVLDSATAVAFQPYHSGSLEYNGYLANISGTWADDQRASRKLQVVNNSLNAMVAVRLHADGTTGKANGYVATHYSNNWRLYRLDSGVPTAIGTTFFDSSPVVTDVVMVEAIGDQISLYENDILRVGPVTDATYLTGGSPGLALQRTSSTAGGAVDDFLGYDQNGGGGSLIGAAAHYYSQQN